MSDMKSKLPDFKEITSIASKLFSDIKKSVKEVIIEYKKKRGEETATDLTKPKSSTIKTVVVEKETIEVTVKKPSTKKAKVAEKKANPDDETKV